MRLRTVQLRPQYEAENHILQNSVVMTEKYKDINLLKETFEYLSAERIAPQTVYSSISSNSSLGMSGENAFDFLEKFGDKYIVEPIFRDKEQSYLLFHVNEWLNRMFGGFRLQLSQIAEADAVNLRYQEVSLNRVSNSHRATNVGFGITYVLPILVALLKVRPGDLVIIENPEAHLHPKAQKLLGELAVKASSAGAQIIIETHSDHILNGIRISVKKLLLEAKQVKLFFLMRENVGDKLRRIQGYLNLKIKYQHSVPEPINIKILFLAFVHKRNFCKVILRDNIYRKEFRYAE